MTGWNSWLTLSINTPWHDWFQRNSQMEKRIIRINPCDSPSWKNEHLSTHLSPLFLAYGSRLLSQGPKASRRRKCEGWIWESRACYHMAWFNGEAVISTAGQIIAPSHDLTPNGGSVREIPFQGNLGWWNIIVWPELVPDFSYQHYLYQKKGDCIFSDTNFGQAKTEASKWNSVSWMQIYISPLLSQKLQLNRWKSQEVGPRWFIETLLSEMIHQ